MTRRFLRFSIRGLLFATTLFAITISIYANRVATQSRAVSALEPLGGYMRWEPNRLGRWLPASITSRLDQNIWMRPQLVGLSTRKGKSEWKTHSSEGIKLFAAALAQLPHVISIHLEVADMTNEALTAIAPMGERIESLSIAKHSYFYESVGFLDKLQLRTLDSFRNLEILKIRSAKLDQAQFASIAQCKSLKGRQFDGCHFRLADFYRLRGLPNLQAVGMHDVCAVEEQPAISQLDFNQAQTNDLNSSPIASEPQILIVPFIEYSKSQFRVAEYITGTGPVPWMYRPFPNAEIHIEQGGIIDVEGYVATSP